MSVPPRPTLPLPPYPMGQACRFYGVSPMTMRRWCEWGLILHRRSTTGQYEIDIWAHLQMSDQQRPDEAASSKP